MTELDSRIELLLNSYDLEDLLERLDIEPAFVLVLLVDYGYINAEQIMEM